MNTANGVKMNARVTVLKSDPPETRAVLATAITEIAEAFSKLSRGGLNRKALVVLLQDATKAKGVKRADIEAILDALPQLERQYCR
jgi:hypothetical protein